MKLHENNNVHLWSDISITDFGRGAWHKQEIFKGRGGLGGTDWTGWSIRKKRFTPAISISQAFNRLDSFFETNTVFAIRPLSFSSPLINQSIANTHLGMGVPALAPAAGNVSLEGSLGFPRNRIYDMNIEANTETMVPRGIQRPNGWPRSQANWLHSDMKDVDYYYNHIFYKTIVEEGGL